MSHVHEENECVFWGKICHGYFHGQFLQQILKLNIFRQQKNIYYWKDILENPENNEWW